MYSARIIPYRGSWLDFEFDGKDLIYFRIDRRRKLLIGTLLQALGMSIEQIYEFFYDKVKVTRVENGWSVPFNPDETKTVKLVQDLVDAETGKVVLESGHRLNKRLISKLKSDGLKAILLSSANLEGRFIASNIKVQDLDLKMGDQLDSGAVRILETAKLKSFEILDIDQVGSYIANSLKADKNSDEEQALLDVFRVIRPG